MGEQDESGDSEHRFPMSGVPIYLIRQEEGIFQALNVPARNELAHKNPELLKGIVAKALQRQAKQEGSYKGTDFIVNWKPSEIPFHTEFEFSVLNNTCHHLASVRNVRTNGLVSMWLNARISALTKPGPACQESYSTSKDFLEQNTGQSTQTMPSYY